MSNKPRRKSKAHRDAIRARRKARAAERADFGKRQGTLPVHNAAGDVIGTATPFTIPAGTLRVGDELHIEATFVRRDAPVT